MSFPQVSILIPVFNRKKYIAECIQSALDQSFTDYEIVVVDNASDDGTWEICQQFSAIDSRVRVFRNDQNIGPVRNWLVCVAHATGEYVKILWSDDLIVPSFLEKTVPYLLNPDVGFVYSTVKIFTRDDKETGLIAYSGIQTGIYESSRYIEGALIEGEDFPVSPGCALFRLGDVKKNLLLHVPNSVASDFSMHAIGNDLLLFLLTAQEYKNTAIVNEPLAYFRTHDESISISSSVGKVALNYDLAKAFFAETYVVDLAVRRKFNSFLFFDLVKYRLVAVSLGIKSIQNFYPTKQKIRFDFIYFANRIGRFLRRRLLSRWPAN